MSSARSWHLSRHAALPAAILLAACGYPIPPEPKDGYTYDTAPADTDSGAETGSDTGGPDSGAETGADSGGDSGEETGADSGGADSGADTADSGGADSGAETGSDSGADTGGDTGGGGAGAWSGVVEIDDVYVAAEDGNVREGRIGSIDNLSVVGDVTGDGVGDTVLGSPFHGPGAVFVLPDSSAWTGDVEVDAVASVEGDAELGFVPLSMRDATGDGLDDLLVGDRTARGVGVGYVFAGPVAGAYTPADATITVTGDWASAEWAEAIDAGDVDGDGVNELAIGAAETGAGVVGIYAGAAGSYAASDGALTWGVAAGDDFGATVVFGDIDGDGYEDLLVGAPGVDTAAAEAGAVYGLPGAATGLGAAAWTFEGPASAGALAGTNSRGVARPADLDGSGAPDVALAAYWVGSVAVFTDPARGSWAWTDATTTLGEAGSDAGASLVTGDLDRDGDADLLVGCYSDDAYASSGGSTWLLLDLPAGSLGRADMDAVLYTPTADEYLGTAVGTRDGRLFVVSSRRDTSVVNGGTLFEVGAW